MDDQKIGLTIFLLKVDQTQAFQKKFSGPNLISIPVSTPLEGVFIPFPPSNSDPPSWVSSVGSILTGPIGFDMSSRSPGGFLVLHHSGRTFVISFGHAFQRLEDEWLERDFGLRVALNVIPKNDVVEIKAEQVFARWHLASERAPRAASVDEFGVDFDRDLVAVVEGVPKQCLSMGSTVRGSTSLRLKLPISELEAILDQILVHFGSDAYKNDWPDIDKINPVKDAGMLELLDDQLNSDLSNEQTRNRIVMFTPSQRRGESLLADSFVYGRMSKRPAYTPYLTMGGWINSLVRGGLTPSVAQAKASAVHVCDDLGVEAAKCTAYDCFGYEYSDTDNVYVLSSGIWYEVVSSFVASINARIAEIDPPSVTLPQWNGTDREGQYNARCAANAEFLNCDAKNVFYGGGLSQFEFCDIVHLASRTLFFAKIVSKSSGMSHLVEQVRRTAQLLFGADSEYRQKLETLFKQHHPTADTTWLQSRPRQGDWHLCMVSLGRQATDLPFFAKCGLAKVYKDLFEQGHSVRFLHV